MFRHRIYRCSRDNRRYPRRTRERACAGSAASSREATPGGAAGGAARPAISDRPSDVGAGDLDRQLTEGRDTAVCEREAVIRHVDWTTAERTDAGADLSGENWQRVASWFTHRATRSLKTSTSDGSAGSGERVEPDAVQAEQETGVGPVVAGGAVATEQLDQNSAAEHGTSAIGDLCGVGGMPVSRAVPADTKSRKSGLTGTGARGWRIINA